jgi:hypothetical protein
MDIDKIINSPIIDEPWEHKIVDDFFSPEEFVKVSEAAKLLAPLAVEGKTRPLWLHEAKAEGVPEETIELIISTADKVLA